MEMSKEGEASLLHQFSRREDKGEVVAAHVGHRQQVEPVAEKCSTTLIVCTWWLRNATHMAVAASHGPVPNWVGSARFYSTGLGPKQIFKRISNNQTDPKLAKQKEGYLPS
jgi:hypothetical protein